MSASLSTPVVPRPVYCVIAGAYADLAVAQAVASGRFTHCGITVELGIEPDWLGAALPADEEWRIEWTKFYYGLDLAAAFRATGEQRFLETWERLVRSFLAQVPAGSDTSDVSARRVQNWVYAWEAFAASPGYEGLSDGLEDELLAGIDRELRHIREHLSAERNHRTLELYALFVVPLALPLLDPDGELVREAAELLRENLLTDVRADGVQREHSTHYHLIALRSFLAARENARRFDLDLGAGYDARLRRACDFALHCHRPDGTIPALSDSDGGSHTDLLALAADLLEREDLRYAATAGAAGTPPRACNVSFSDSGYHVQRSGWGDGERALRDERFLIFDCGELGDGGHHHYDLLSIDAYAEGRALVVDPGRHTYAEETPNLRRWFKGTAAHNTVVVDGLDQAPYRRGKARKGTRPAAVLLSRTGEPGLDVLHGKALSTCYEAAHARRVAFVAGEYWIVEDELAGERPHDYDLRFHLAAEAEGRVRVMPHGDGFAVRAPGLALIFAGPRRPRIEAGWVAPEYGVKLAAPVVSVVAEDAIYAMFTTLLLPLADTAPLPAFTVRRTLRDTKVVVEGAARDVVRWSAGHASWQRREASA